MKDIVEVGIRETMNGYQAFFNIGVQTFFLQACEDETKDVSKAHAIWYKDMLEIAFMNLINDNDK